MRGTGNISEDSNTGIVEVKSPLKLFCHDWVVHPSHKNSYMEEVIQEHALDPYINNEEYKKQLNEGLLIPFNKTEVKDYLEEESNRIKKVKDQMKISEDAELQVAPNGQFIRVKDKNQIFNIALEEYIIQELDDYLLNL
jgi:hypothetical protein